MLDLEVASSNDQSFSHSDMRRTARTMLQFLPGTDFIFSGYAGEPNYDNMFAGSNFDALDYDIYNILQRDMMVDGGLRPVKEEDVIEAVSYTHLDVYKRQSLYMGRFPVAAKNR